MTKQFVISNRSGFKIKNLNIWLTFFVVNIIFLSVLNVNASALQCENLFYTKRQIQPFSQNDLSSTKLTSNLKKVAQVTRSFIFPKNQFLAEYFSNENKKYLVLEKIIPDSQINSNSNLESQFSGQSKTKVERQVLKTQFDHVIDATLEHERAFFNSLTQESLGSVVFFIDVNNLGYVNKTFISRQAGGDHYIELVVEALKEMFAQKGLIFRLGGDEFSVVLPFMSPTEIQQLQQQLLNKVWQKTDAFFERERVMSRKQVTSLSAYRDTELLSESDYQSLLKEYLKVKPYFKGGLSLGAQYITKNRNGSKLQDDIETQATKMKIAYKSAYGLDVSKYNGIKNSLPAGFVPNFNFRYEIPLVEALADEDISKNVNKLITQKAFERNWLKFSSNSLTWGDDKSNQWNLFKRMYQVGEYYVEQLVSTFGSYRVIARKKDSALVEENVLSLQYHSHSKMMNGLTYEVRQIIKDFIDPLHLRDLSHVISAHSLKVQDRGYIEIDFSGLGKINYLFSNKTQDGDRILSMIAQVIRESIREIDIPIKLSGSSYLVLFDQYGPLTLSKVKERLSIKLRHDERILKFFTDEIDQLKQKSASETDQQKRESIDSKIQEIEGLMNIPELFILRESHLPMNYNKDKVEKAFKNLKLK